MIPSVVAMKILKSLGINFMRGLWFPHKETKNTIKKQEISEQGKAYYV